LILENPPSTNISVPCIKAASFDARKVIAFATSNGCPKRAKTHIKCQKPKNRVSKSMPPSFLA